jgi:hypothetical protein
MSVNFNVGRVSATAALRESASHSEMITALKRHRAGDWGEVTESDWQSNQDALESEDRLVSIYTTNGGERFYIITEADRCSTTLLLAEEY